MEELGVNPRSSAEAPSSNDRHVSSRANSGRIGEELKAASRALLPSVQELLRETSLNGSQSAPKEREAAQAETVKHARPFIEEL